MRTDHVFRVTVPSLGFWLLVLGCSAPGDGRIVVEEADPTPVLNTDGDNDGVTTFEGDCDDDDPDVYPDAPEGTGDPDALVGDGKDNDCDGLTDEGTIGYDDDLDGLSEEAGDCDDSDASLHPGQVDGCDGIDNDCDGQIDEATGDAYEPNELPETASSSGDVTCKSLDLNFNLWPSSPNTITDTDFYKVQVRESATCEFGLTVTVSGTPEQANVDIKLYRDESSVLKLRPWTTDTSTTVNGVKIRTFSYLPSSSESSGTYFLEVAAVNPVEASCQDDTLMTVTGEAL